MKSRTKKTLIIVIGVVVIGGGAAFSLIGDNSNATTVQVDLAKIRDISEQVSASGRIQPQTKVDITSQVSGEIVALYVSEGEIVSKGDLLIQIDRVQLGSDREQAQYSLDEIEARADGARVQRDQNKEEFERQTKLRERKLNSESDFTTARYSYENSKATYLAMQSQVKTLKARLNKAQDNLDRATITAPMDGVVTFLAAEVGEIAQAQTSFTQGKTLMTISDLSVFEVDVDVDETEIAKIGLGQLAAIEVDAFPDSVFDGTVVEIGNSAILQGQGTQEFSINFRVKVRFAPTSAHIRPGMSAAVDITTSTEENAVIVPYASIVLRELPEDTLDENEGSSGGIFANEVNAAENTVDDDNEDADGSDDEGGMPGNGLIDDEDGYEDEEPEKKTGVFVVRDGIAVFLEVQTGIADEKNIVMISGVQKGDTIISGSFKTLRELEDGDEVKIDQKSLDDLDGKKSKSRKGRRGRRGRS